MHIRQIALVAEKLEPIAEQLAAVFTLGEPYRDEGVSEFGLENVVFAVGDTFLEVVSPATQGTTAGRLLERRGGDGGYMVILQTSDLSADRARFERLGVRIVWEIELPDIATVHLHPRDVGGAIVSLDAPVPPESWRWAGPDWQARAAGADALRITGAEVQSADPEAMSRRWAEVLGQPQGSAAAGTGEIPLEKGSLRFVADRGGRGEGISAVTIEVRDPAAALARAASLGLPLDGDSFAACGVRFDLCRG